MPMRPFLFSLLPIFFNSILAAAAPAQILLIRHGEKPDKGSHLSDRGWERARALPALFHDRPEFLQFGPPAALYAMGPGEESGADPLGKSVRAIETLQFASTDLRLAIVSRYTRDEIQPLLNEILQRKELDGKLVVICWEHKWLSNIADALSVQPAPNYPGDRFDRAWLITLKAQGSPEFRDLPENLLPGDSAQ